MKTAASPADIGRQIGQISTEIERLESAGPPLPARIAAAEEEWARCEAHFRKFGFNVVGSVPSERQHFQQMSYRGGLMVGAGEAILAAERQRIEAAYQAAGSVEFDATRLAELQRERRRLLAQREMQWRSEEAAGQVVDRATAFDVECFLAPDGDLALVAAGKEAAA